MGGKLPGSPAPRVRFSPVGGIWRGRPAGMRTFLARGQDVARSSCGIAYISRPRAGSGAVDLRECVPFSPMGGKWPGSPAPRVRFSPMGGIWRGRAAGSRTFPAHGQDVARSTCGIAYVSRPWAASCPAHQRLAYVSRPRAGSGAVDLRECVRFPPMGGKLPGSPAPRVRFPPAGRIWRGRPAGTRTFLAHGRELEALVVGVWAQRTLPAWGELSAIGVNTSDRPGDCPY